MVKITDLGAVRAVEFLNGPGGGFGTTALLLLVFLSEDSLNHTGRMSLAGVPSQHKVGLTVLLNADHSPLFEAIRITQAELLDLVLDNRYCPAFVQFFFLRVSRLNEALDTLCCFAFFPALCANSDNGAALLYRRSRSQYRLELLSDQHLLQVTLDSEHRL